MGEAEAAGSAEGGGVVAGGGVEETLYVWRVCLTHAVVEPMKWLEDSYSDAPLVVATGFSEKFHWLEFYGSYDDIVEPIRFNRDHVISFFMVGEYDVEARGRSEAVEGEEPQDS